MWVKRIEEPFDAARPMTDDRSRPVVQAFWSRDSRRILFVQDQGGDENFHVHAVDPAAPAAAGDRVPPALDLTPGAEVQARIYELPEDDPRHDHERVLGGRLTFLSPEPEGVDGAQEQGVQEEHRFTSSQRMDLTVVSRTGTTVRRRNAGRTRKTRGKSIFTGAALVFFAYIGFDVVATTAEETHNPQRNVPIGIFGSLAIVTVLYMAVSLVITGMQNFQDIDPEDGAPLATAFDAVGVGWMGDVISVGACIGLVVVVMILMLGQTRVAFAMARDGLLPRWLAQTHGKHHTPHRITFVTGIAVAAISGFVDLSTLADLVNIGTLFAFVLVSVGVVILRRTRPDLDRGFRVPGATAVAVVAVVACLYLMLNLVGETWVRFLIWMALGFVVYFAYGRRHSRVGRAAGEAAAEGVESRST